VVIDKKVAELEHRALQRILADLWIIAGFGGLDRRTTILRSVHRLVTRLLRPAEAAARRLILVLARGIVVTLPPARIAAPMPDNTGPDGARPPADVTPTDQLPDEWRPDRWQPFVLAESLSRLLNLSVEPRPFRGIPSVRNDQEIDGSRLAHRIEALCHALDDIQAAAQRMARWQALRKRAQERGVFCATHPLRPGPPLDLRGRARQRLKKHELFGILESTHERAWWARNAPPDTS
jgi:hypothetical protein